MVNPHSPTLTLIARPVSARFAAALPCGMREKIIGMNDDSVELPLPSERLETVVISREKDLTDGFRVRRVLPSARRRMVGPFIFFDQMGPEVLKGDGSGLDVAPHPHIGLATLTYLFDGALLHRDSLGSSQIIRAGEVNWMTAGSGIAHSERTPGELRKSPSALHGLQSWIALPLASEETSPSFHNYDADATPLTSDGGITARVIVGSAYGKISPVETFSDTLYVDIELKRSGRFPVDSLHEERALYVVSGEVFVEGERDGFTTGQLLVAKPGAQLTIRCSDTAPARVILLGGSALEGPRHIWWNFVSSSRDRIEQAKEDWRAGRFAPVAGDSGYIPLPSSGPASVVRYP